MAGPQLARLATEELQSVVQHNCHISDARHASNYTLCVYLLKMREYYRWEQQLALGKTLDKQAIGDWLSEREAFWDSIEDADFSPIRLNGRKFNPFASVAINEQLIPEGYIYSAGYGIHSKPLFFLAKLDRYITESDTHIYISSRELARDLTAPPAMSMGNRIFIRKESLQRVLWEKIDEWRWNKPDNAMGRTLAFYDFDNAFEASLERMTANEIDSLLLHESGEVQAGLLINDGWHDMLDNCQHPQLELIARAIRDHLADALSTLPALIENLSPSLHFYMASLSGMRKHLVPSLTDAYNQWVASGCSDALRETVAQGESHWLIQANRMIKFHTNKMDTLSGEVLDSLIEEAVL